MDEYEFWFSDAHGLIRRRRGSGWFKHPEVWSEGEWAMGSEYVMDAITGMGEDPWSCGEWADKWDQARAKEYARENAVDLFADNPDDWGDSAIVSIASRQARRWHAGQVDKSGVPYFEHCTRVARKLEDDKGRAVALLHDVLEDTDTTEQTLRVLFGGEIVDAVVALTRVDGQDPDEYYRRVRSNPLALRVKIADIHDNLEPSRLAALDEETRQRLMHKYGSALIALAR